MRQTCLDVPNFKKYKNIAIRMTTIAGLGNLYRLLLLLTTLLRAKISVLTIPQDASRVGPPGSWTWANDICIICPGSQRLVSKGTDTVPGKAAALYEDKKTKTYSDQANFVPFIVETGGRINAAGLRFLSRILPLEAEGTAGLTRRHGRAALRGISRALALPQGYMLDCRGDTRA